MIKNINQLSNTNPRHLLLKIANQALETITPQHLFQNQLRKKSLQSLATFRHLYIFSIGKAAKSMAQAIKPLLPRKPHQILLADQGHPLPTQEGLKKTAKIIQTAKSLTAQDLAIVLISGGGSAMFVSPAPGITLAEKIQLTKKLLKSGATIQEVNTVRKQLSQVKGGHFAELLYPATVMGFVISDVLGNDLSSIASGPLSPNKTTAQDALKILKKYKITPAKSILKHLNQKAKTTQTQEKKYFKKITIKILADQNTLAQKAKESAESLGLKAVIMPQPLAGEARDTAKKFLQFASTWPTNFRTSVTAHAHTPALTSTPPTLLIASGETTVTCKGRGHGGRNQEFVLAALQHLQPNQTVLSIGSDGVDGICPTEVAGAIGDSQTLNSASKKHLKIQDYLQNNDSYTFFKKAGGGHIKTGKTGTNLGDLALLLVQ